MANFTKEETFELTEDHIKLLTNVYVSWNDCKYGAPEINPKRPYGNSDVEWDVAEILGWEVDPDEGLTDEQRELAHKLHRETEYALEIVLHACGSFKPGTFVSPDMSSLWERVEEPETILVRAGR
jgi:hypothetical protein